MAAKIYDDFAERLSFLATKAANSAARSIAARLPGNTFNKPPMSEAECRVYAEEIELAGERMIADAVASYDIAARTAFVNKAVLKAMLVELGPSYVDGAREMCPVPAGLGRSARQALLNRRLDNLSDVLVDEVEQHVGRFAPKTASWFDRHPLATKAGGYALTFCGGLLAAVITKWLTG